MVVDIRGDVDVLDAVLADRLEVMRSIAMFPEEKRKKKSWESMNLYAQIAHKLGLYNIKSELEDLSLSQLEPADHKHITDKLREGEKERLDFIERFAKSSTSWAEARPFYEMLLDYAEDDRDIKQKARNIKAYHTRLKNARSPKVFIKTKNTNINKPTFGSMYDIHDNDEVTAG